MLATYTKQFDEVTQQTTNAKSAETKCSLEALITNEIRHLTTNADACIFAIYDARRPIDGPVDFETYTCTEKQPTLNVNIHFDFEGIGVWYICNRYGEVYQLRHILVQIHNGRFVKGKLEHFQGYWDEFPQFVADDPWVKALAPTSLKTKNKSHPE